MIASFNNVIARNPGGVTKQSLEIALNLNGLLRRNCSTSFRNSSSQ
jgi:hypothetical protein